jgi:hypothetical protein
MIDPDLTASNRLDQRVTARPAGGSFSVSVMIWD